MTDPVPQPTPALDLDAIRWRHEATEDLTLGIAMGTVRASARDVPALLAEVARLTAELERTKESRDYYHEMAIERGKIMHAAETELRDVRSVNVLISEKSNSLQDTLALWEPAIAATQACIEAVDAIRAMMATSSRDWAEVRGDALLWGVFLGWDPDPDDAYAEFQNGAMAEVAARHGWDDVQVARVRRFHAAVNALTSQPTLADIQTDHNGHHSLVRDFGGPRPTITVLCGSTRFKDVWYQQSKRLTYEGKIVLSVGDLDTSSAARDVNVPIDPELKAALDELHKRKIDLADEVLVLNVGGYIGESTRSEIEYAMKIGRQLRYLEPMVFAANPADTQTEEGR